MPFTDDLCSQTTYEELKHDLKNRIKKASGMLPDYLWGIETDYGSGYDSGNRGRSQTTYEELKLCTFELLKLLHLVELPDYLWGIETQKIAQEVARRIKGSQTTYEELKLKYFFYIIIVC